MTVVQKADEIGGEREPIKFPDAKASQAKKRAAKALSPAEPRKPVEIDRLTPLVELKPVERDKAEHFVAPSKRWLGMSWMTLSFLLMVAIPGAFAGVYYLMIASPQYVVETQFSVRGSNQSSMASLGLSGLFGNSVQSNDSYIVSTYVESQQLVRDVRDQLGIDLRKYYTKPHTDFWYRIKADMPLETFTEYWKNMVEVSYNSTTGNTTLFVFAFSADDAKAITDAVLKVSQHLVNNLSEDSRREMTKVAQQQVERAEAKLTAVRNEIRKLRAQQQIIDPRQLAQLDFGLTQDLEAKLQEARTRMKTALQSVSPDAPQVVVLKRTIKGLEDQLETLKEKMMSPDEPVKAAAPVRGDRVSSDGNIPGVLTKFEELTVEQEFATKAYTTSLAAFETSLYEAQKQDRYFAVFVEPIRPEIALYPKRLLDTFIAFIVLTIVWLLAQFFYRSFKEHAI